ncbi:hypothetical protein KIN20_015788 [Parelaphostrongylus tenuis]|uniref:Uncharacterized protein n=1 Tax=Parelaphostrongylus tenuis TaxID=148309 RepID=A0AAD5MYZ4_PARTN|nr:hypothetical protein KIN20_015788 [Parelaphostrongylus tenuis]
MQVMNNENTTVQSVQKSFRSCEQLYRENFTILQLQNGMSNGNETRVGTFQSGKRLVNRGGPAGLPTAARLFMKSYIFTRKKLAFGCGSLMAIRHMWNRPYPQRQRMVVPT